MDIEVGLKYCGGCNPAYDRKEIADIIGRQSGIKLKPYNENEISDVVLIISGCSADCVNAWEYKSRCGTVLINSPEQVYEVIRQIRTFKNNIK